ncbi:hypothetical protein PF005_g29417 [Phytophthora fragariae]|uniref:GHMP kinase N-terminal domain-containing protein n=2 Tax=Phytophthora fragariae TaxID=53985 RepID=A0A6A3VIK2_9STRA|nr:hypothetical protein PF003_g37060 [Phytophthora fragariae]KAE8919837.1 hypothetical protein PF009_g29861 [Phytophthora fragariae]KAE8964737.1 hypothetical protein PF011_g28559 [Phytophthora fragariae]KAE9063364.1 hypothetical protein PF010_g29022 [Phytophthora fragariae]KAE9063532.1 hypothetical protein PF007_g29520 [Phytophthora fragariae]
MSPSVGCIPSNEQRTVLHTVFISIDIPQLIANVLEMPKANTKTVMSPPRGVHAVIMSTASFGSGLSNSAALEVGFATFRESLFEIKGVSAIQKALLCQAGEHNNCNVPCGIMD